MSRKTIAFWAMLLGWESRDLPIAVREAKTLLYILESLHTSGANSRPDCFIDNKTVVAAWQKQVSKNPALSQVKKSIFQLSLRSNLALLTFFAPSSDNPADRASCPISTADLAQWLGRSSNKYTDLILCTYLPSHQMSTAIRMANLFVSLPHFRTQVVSVWTALHKPSVPQRTPMPSRPLSFLGPFWSLFRRSLVHSLLLYRISALGSIGGLSFNTEPLVVLRSAPKVRKISFSVPDVSLNVTFSPRPLQWELWAFLSSLNWLLAFFVLYSRSPVFGVHPFSVQSANTPTTKASPSVNVVVSLVFRTPPISVFISSDRLTKYR